MNIKFDEVLIHNFLSLGDADILLENNGVVLVRGINHDVSDSALSNGSGKSAIFNAICYALTGETIQGVSSDLANIHGDGSCMVELRFSVDNDNYIVTRYRNDPQYGTNMKIIRNNEDISGKGIRDSSKVLATYLPDLTSDFIGSVVILGQGLPHRFSDNTPSGRKEILEKLSKSDYMIEDIKGRLDERKSVLDAKERENEDSLLKNSTESNMNASRATELSQRLERLSSEAPQKTVAELKRELDAWDAKIGEASTESDAAASKTAECHNMLQTKQARQSEKFRAKESELKEGVEKIRNEMDLARGRYFSLEIEIKKLKAITDVCPTCGQRLNGVHKPDTTSQEKELAELSAQIGELNNKAKQEDFKNSGVLSLLKEEQKKELTAVQASYDSAARNQDEKYRQVIILQKEAASIRDAYNYSLSYEKNREDIKKEILATNAKIEEGRTLAQKLQLEGDQIKAHSDVIAKMLTAVKRDFRGYLLINVIEFIQRRARDYAKDVFGTEDILFCLNSNNIDLGYNGKSYENLSGGEKQKVDLIIQFALKDMLSQYLNVHCNILVLDEIFDNLDTLGCQKIIQLIDDRMGGISSTFIISHHADELQIAYDKELVVEKGADGVSSVL